LEHHTSVKDYLSLPIPVVNDMGAGKDPQAWEDWASNQKAADGRPAPHGKSLEQEVLKTLPTPRAFGAMNSTSDRGIGTPDDGNLETVIGRLATLPTPNTMDSLPVREGAAWEKAKRRGNSSSVREDSGNLREVVIHNLPTPAARDYKDTTVTMAKHRPTDTDSVNRALASIDSAITWGKYEPAIRRWESLTRPAPEPTVPYKDKRRLNPVFVEWMMGLDEGHVTGHGLSAAKELKMLGNGVVPQQAREAFKQLMERKHNEQTD